MGRERGKKDTIVHRLSMCRQNPSSTLYVHENVFVWPHLYVTFGMRSWGTNNTHDGGQEQSKTFVPNHYRER